MYIESVPNRNSPPAVLLRESFRDAGKVNKRTLANLSKWPPTLIEGLRVLLKGGAAVPRLEEAFDIVRSKPHGHVAAVLGTLRKLRLDRTIAGADSPERRRVLAMIVARVLDPGSKLATARGLAEATARDSLAETLALGEIDEDDLYAAMDWLLKRQDAIERRLAKRHLKDGALVFYDLTSVHMEGRRCALAQRGYSRDGRRGKLQIEFGLLCDAEGRPVAVEVFAGNTADPATVGAQVDKLRRRFGFSRVVLVGDRGMLTEARIREDVRPAGLDWISALRGPAVRSLVESGAVQLSLFDETDLVEIRSDEYPGEQLMVCRNPLLAEQRARKREELLQATEALLDPVVAATKREKWRLKGEDKIGVRVGKVIGQYKMAKHFELKIGAASFGYRRKPESIAAEAALDGLYVVRTSLAQRQLDAEGAVRDGAATKAALAARCDRRTGAGHRSNASPSAGTTDAPTPQSGSPTDRPPTSPPVPAATPRCLRAAPPPRAVTRHSPGATTPSTTDDDNPPTAVPATASSAPPRPPPPALPSPDDVPHGTPHAPLPASPCFGDG